jgi:hypothetical protein
MAARGKRLGAEGAFRPRVDPRWLEGIWVSNGELLTLHRNGNFTRSPHDHDTEMARGLYEFVASSHVLRFSVRDAGAGATVFNPPQIEEREVAELHHHTMLLVCPATNRDIWYEKRVEPV